MKSTKDYKKIDDHTDLILFEDGSCRFKNYLTNTVSREDYKDEFEANLNFHLGAVEWVSE